MADFVNPNIDHIVAALQTVRKINGFGEQSVNSTRHVQLYGQATLSVRGQILLREELVPATVTGHEQEPKDVHDLCGVDSCQVLTVLNGKRLLLDANGKMHG
ncbi:hypothetical protein PGTUg99_023664 [Puccinia graminis f. sp. tritici]|uniref:Uncharacterized protein n=1 Tax=Puccinia graminis f. sp. tritici TaxID=56615 RepID=A0A5B0LL58_PUCGR|nr:hypothetical protein PGTUg99_023664 [Puccinia graminis f. sp. tritici]